jgi:hypothetical protein
MIMHTYTVTTDTELKVHGKEHAADRQCSISEWFLLGQVDCLTLVDVNDLHGEGIHSYTMMIGSGVSRGGAQGARAPP